MNIEWLHDRKNTFSAEQNFMHNINMCFMSLILNMQELRSIAIKLKLFFCQKIAFFYKRISIYNKQSIYSRNGNDEWFQAIVFRFLSLKT